MNFILFLFLVFIILLIIKNNSSNFTNNNLYFTNKKIHFTNNEVFLNINNFNTYVINLVKNKYRLDNFINEYNKSDLKNIPLTIYPAIVGKDLDLLNYVTPKAYQQILETEKTNTRKYHYELSRGAVGCYLSHLDIWKKISESDKEYGIIFEDDVMIATDFYSRLQDGLRKVPDDWDMYMCGIMCLKCNIKDDYIKVYRFWGTHGYLLKKETAKKLYNYLNKLISKQIDADLSLLIKSNKIIIYSINPIIVAQGGYFGSDIQTVVNNNIDALKEDFNQTKLKFIKN